MPRPAPPIAALLALALAAAAQNRPDPELPAADWRGQQVVAGEILVQFRAGTSGAQQAAHLAQLGATPRASVSAGLVRAGLPAGADLDAQLEAWAQLPEVEFAQPNVLHSPTGTPDDPKYPLQWHLPKVRADLAWDGFEGDPDTVVAVIDSGVDVDHPDLAAQLAWGSDPYAGDADPDDADGHGTHCAGLAAALAGIGFGVAGAAPACRFAAYRCGNGSFPSSALVAAIDDAVARGARVLSMSWGSGYADPAIKAALQAARDAGCLLVAAAGNDGSSASFYPAAHAFVLAVGATTSSDAQASFSNWGAWVDLAAPGQAIYSTAKGGGFKYMSGTSMACPLVAGAGALLYARLPARSESNAALVRAALEQAAVPLGAWVTHGRLDLAAALELLDAQIPPALSALEPAQLPALGGTLVLHGGGLLAATEVTLDGDPLDFAPGGGGSLVCAVPPSGPLGLQTVSVDTPSGVASLQLERLVTVPPGLLVPNSTPAGAEITWNLGGPANDHAFLLLALAPDTFAWGGATLLVPVTVLDLGPLDAAGLGSLQAWLPAAAAGTTFRSQLATWDAGLSGVSPITTTVIE
jgi:thermitase